MKKVKNETKVSDNTQKELRISDVIESVCDNCEPVSGFYLGTTCPKCNKPFRSVKQTVR
jgi:hypothetical protein